MGSKKEGQMAILMTLPSVGDYSADLRFRASACNVQQCDILTCVDSGAPLQAPFKLRTAKWCSVSSLTIIEYLSD